MTLWACGKSSVKNLCQNFGGPTPWASTILCLAGLGKTFHLNWKAKYIREQFAHYSYPASNPTAQSMRKKFSWNLSWSKKCFPDWNKTLGLKWNFDIKFDFETQINCSAAIKVQYQIKQYLVQFLFPRWTTNNVETITAQTK